MEEREIVIRQEALPLSAADVTNQKRLIQQVVRAVMIKDTHYGVIPGTQKPTLFKSGAEAILSTFRIAVIPEVSDLGDGDQIRYMVYAKGVLPDGTVVGVGIGECSSNEEKYKWRGAVCDKEFDSVFDDRRRIKFSAKWNNQTRKKDIIEEVKQVRTESADIANTILKMAKKRAMIDLTLTATGASDTFDQDLDDLPEEVVESFAEGEQSGKPFTEAPQKKESSSEKLATEGQTKMLFAKLKSKGADIDTFLKAYNVDKLESVPFSKVTEAAKAIDDGKFDA